MNPIDDHAFDERIRQGVSDAVPPDVQDRLRDRLDEFRSGRGPVGAMTTPTDRRWRRPGRWGIGIACAAGVLLLAAAPWLLAPGASFAQVANAVRQQPWIHVVTVFGDRSVHEEWYAPSRQISASRGPRSIEYHDDRLGIYDNYDPDEKVVYRLPAYGRPRGAELEATVKALGVLLQGDRVPDRPLDQLGFLGPDRDRLTVLDQAVEKGPDWLNYHLTVQDAREAVRMRMVFRVDAKTRLPASCRVEATHAGQPATLEMQFDYPERGPADIHELGVPRVAKVVDRVPGGDLKRILATIQAGRERMDDYRAVFVTEYGGNHAWWQMSPRIFYRKGTRFRADSNAEWKKVPFKRPPEGVDRRQWWFEQARTARFFPQSVIRDGSRYISTTKPVDNPDGSQHAEIVSVQTVKDNARPAEVFPAEWSMRPEFACRPPMGLGSPHFEPVLDLHPTEGPEGCVLLAVRNAPNRDPINEKGIGSPDGSRYWLDPQRDYIVTRWQMARRVGNGREEIVEDDTVEEAARSPQGVWYATRVRRSFGGKYGDQVYHIYVDFDAKLPDALFEPPKPGTAY